MAKKHIFPTILLLAGITFFAALFFPQKEILQETAPLYHAPFPEQTKGTEVSSAKNALVLIYMIGSDLESVDGSASDDLYEILSGSSGKKVKVLVETGGSRKWKSKKSLGIQISSRSNQRYLISNGKIKKVCDAGKRKNMTRPETLSDFLSWAKENYPSDRYQLIFWNHGGGSVGGFGHDEFHPKGTLTADEIAPVLKDCGISFDFIGYDACLMATLENALTLSPYASFLIGSEESESGYGWEYSTWISRFSEDPSIPTQKLARTLINDSVYVVKKYNSSNPATLSMIDLKKLSSTVPDSLDAFGKSASSSLLNGQFKSYSKYRKKAKFFGPKDIDSIDLIDFCKKVGSPEAQALSSVLKDCIVYHKNYSIKNSNGIASYFPFYDFDTYESSYHNYKKMALGENYLKFINSFSTIALGGSLSNQDASSPFDQEESYEDPGAWEDWEDFSNWDDFSNWEDFNGWDDFGDWEDFSDWEDPVDWENLDSLGGWYFTNQSLPKNLHSKTPVLSKEITASTQGSIKTISISLAPEKKKLAAGESFFLVPTLTPKDASAKIAFCSSNPSVASVSPDGKVTAVAPGKASIAAALKNGKAPAICKVIVEKKDSFAEYEDKEWFDKNLADSLKEYYKTNELPEELPLIQKGKGKNSYYALHLNKKIWNLIDDEQLQVYIKDKNGGHFFLGSDRYSKFDKDGDLKVDYDNDYTWLGINGQLVSCYSEDFELLGKKHWREISRIPVLINNQKADLLVCLDDTHKNFYVLGARMKYSTVVSKGLRKLKKGDTLQFLCQYFDKNGKESTKKFGRPMTLKTSQKHIQVTYQKIGDYDTLVGYQLTDFFNRHYWTEMISYHN